MSPGAIVSAANGTTPGAPLPLRVMVGRVTQPPPPIAPDLGALQRVLCDQARELANMRLRADAQEWEVRRLRRQLRAFWRGVVAAFAAGLVIGLAVAPLGIAVLRLARP